jgi:hypothetical protein
MEKTMNRIKERFILMRPILIPFILYIGSLVVSSTWIEANSNSSWIFWVSLIPLIPSLWMAVMIVQFMKKLDELEQRIIYEAAAFSFMITFLMILSFSFLSIAGVSLPHPTVIVLFMAVLMVVGKLIGNRKYK